MHMQYRARATTQNLITAGLLLASLSVAHAAPRGRADNTLPEIQGSPPTLAEVDSPYFFRPLASDADGDSLRFKIQSRPAWASFDSSSGVLSGQPTTSNVGLYADIVISVSDGQRGNTWVALPAFSISVKSTSNSAPIIAGNPLPSARVRSTYDFVPSASDPDGDPISFRISNKPAWAAFNSANGELRGSPTDADIGVYSNIRIEATDGSNTSSLPEFSVTVEAAPNQPPVISGAPAGAVTAGQAYSFQPSASDPDGDPLTYSIANKPTWAAFSSSTGRLSGTPSSSQVGAYSGITISVSDGTASAALPSFAITVEAGNRAPTISGAPAGAVTAGQAYSFQPSASDPDGDPLTYSIANKPTWAAFSSSTGRLSGTPSSSQVGAYSGITISVSDGTASAALPSFSINVEAGNRAPTISGAPAGAVTAGQAYSFQPSASDPDGDPLTYSIANKPTWAAFSSSTGRLSGTPSSSQVGAYSGITISVSDGTASAALPSFSITVEAGNRAPTISGAPAGAVTAGQAYSFQPSASDPDGDPLTYSIANKPTWAAFSSSTGRLSGTPSSSQVGAYSGITISVSDGTASAALPSFSITVEAGNRAPTISGAPAGAVTAGQAYSFQPSASDPDGDPLTYSIANKPTWAAFSSSTGRLSGTPSSSFAGIAFSGITISVSDGALSAALPSFSITVEAGNRAPTISGTPAGAATAGQAYSFQPSASDPDGDHAHLLDRQQAHLGRVQQLDRTALRHAHQRPGGQLQRHHDLGIGRLRNRRSRTVHPHRPEHEPPADDLRRSGLVRDGGPGL